MIPNELNPLEIILKGLEQRKLHFDKTQLSSILFDRAYTELELDGVNHPFTKEQLDYKIVRYATDILVELDDIYRKQDIDLYLELDADGNYYITNTPPNNGPSRKKTQ